MKTNLYLIAILLALAVGTAPALHAGIYVQCPPDADNVDSDGDGIVDNDHICMHLAAGDGFTKMVDGHDQYTFGFSNVTGVDNDTAMEIGRLAAEWPAPTIELKEGQHFFLSLSNVGMPMRPDLFDAHSVHWHGFPNAANIFDGLPESGLTINMGSTLTYYYYVAEPGTYFFHCHVEATEHMQMGMLGQLFVHPLQNTLADGTDLNGFIHHTGYKYAYNDGDGSTYYDVAKALQLAGFDPVFHDQHIAVQPLPFAAMRDTYPMLNGRGYPDTVDTGDILNTNGHAAQKQNALITASVGDKILLRLSNVSTTDFYTVSVMGIPMRVVAKGAALLRGPSGMDLSYTANSVTLGGGEAYDLILDTAGVPAGTYFFYTTNLNHLSNHLEDFGGIMTEIRLNP